MFTKINLSPFLSTTNVTEIQNMFSLVFNVIHQLDLIARCRVFQIAVGVGWGRNFAERIFLPSGENLRRSDFGK